MMMTVEELRTRRKELLIQKQELIDAGADELEILLIDEDLHDVNVSLRRLTPNHRIGRVKVGSNPEDAALSTGQYSVGSGGRGVSEVEDLALDQIEPEAEPEREPDAGIFCFAEAMKYVDATITKTQKKYFDLWTSGKTMRQVAEECGVNVSTVSRELAGVKRRLRATAENYGVTDQDWQGRGVRVDASEPATARALLCTCTAKQIVYLYLYYGEWLSIREIQRLIGIDHSSVFRSINAGLRNIGLMFPGREILLENVDVLGDMAYELYMEQGDWTEAELTPKPTPGFQPGEYHDWGRWALGLPVSEPRSKYSSSGSTVADRPSAMVVTARGEKMEIHEHRESACAPRGKLMLALLKRKRELDAGKLAIASWLTALFQKLAEKCGVRKFRSAAKREVKPPAPKQQEYYDLYASGKSMRQIADEQGVNVSSVSRGIAVAKRKLAEEHQHG